MPSDPVIIDCGGSTRLKRVTATSASSDRMDGLIDVRLLSGPPAPNTYGSQFPVPGPFSQFMIVFQDASGATYSYTQSLPSGASPASASAAFTITSELRQQVIGRLVTGGVSDADLELTLIGTDKIDPIVECKQLANKRRYVVSNAGAIREINLAGTSVFSTWSQPFKLPNSPNIQQPIVYVSIIVS